MAWEGFKSEGFFSPTAGGPISSSPAMGGGPADVINEMANTLDQAASAVSSSGAITGGGQGDYRDRQIESRGSAYDQAVANAPAGAYMSAGHTGGEFGGDGYPLTVANVGGATMGGGPSTAPAVPDLGPTPSLGDLEAVISGVGDASQFFSGVGGATMGGGPASDPSLPGNLTVEAEVAEVSPGQEAATFMNDYRSQQMENRPGAMSSGMNAQVSLSEQLSDLTAQADDLRNLATGLLSVQKGYPNPGMVSGDPVRLAADYESRGYPSMAGTNYGAALSALNTPGGFATTTPYVSPEQAVATPIRDQFDPTAYPSMAGVDYSGALSAQVTPGGFQTETPYVAQTKTHDEWYPNHRKYASMAGVASIKAMFDGTNKAWKNALKEDMRAKGILGKNQDKYMSHHWKEYEALFDENGVALDGSGDFIPGTEMRMDKGFGGVAQGLFGGLFSGLARPGTTSSGIGQDIPLGPYGTMATEVADYVPSETLPSNIQVAQQDVVREGADMPIPGTIEWMRTIYPWAASLPDGVLGNAIKYPDYLRLILEAVQSGEDIPLVVPDWVVAGKSGPDASDNSISFGNTQELTWDRPAWMT